MQDTFNVNLFSTIESVQVSTEYFDAMGRPLQTVIKQASPSKKDFVAPVAFDFFGNPSTQYLPYTAQTGNADDGKFKASPFTDDSVFYSTFLPDEQINYGLQFYDGSPLNRTVQQNAPGNSWAGSNKGISYSQRSNTLSDSVRIWAIDINNEDDVPLTTAMYPANSLLVKEMTDERGIKAISYTDETGHTVLTKTQLADSRTTGHPGWLCTYYIYDEMNHLRMVIPPKAVDYLDTNGWVLNSTVINNLCFSYWYDNRGRLLTKHIPGKGKTYMAYDLLDRLVMSQDENLRLANQWAFIKYDGQGRPVKTGLITKNQSKDVIQANAAASSDYPTLSGTYTILTETYYDDYNWTSGTGLTGNLNNTYITSSNFILSYNTSPDYARPMTKSTRIRGSITGSKKMVLGTPTYLYTAIIYNEDGKAIQTKQVNYSGGQDIATTEYDFSGKVLRTQLHHQESGAGNQSHDLLTKYTYDHAGRPLTITKNIDNTADSLISAYTYNELGQVKQKVVGNGLATQNYSYNMRGWLTGINKEYVTGTNSPELYFGEALYYDYGFTNTQINGNIAGVKWKSTGDDVQRAYGYGYDNTNRLNKADYAQENLSTETWGNSAMDFTVSGITYDANGNILSMKQRGVNINTSVTIDSLTYNYFSNSNRLSRVTDAISDNTPWGDFKDTTATGDDYAYDINGNIVKDNNKHLLTGAGGNGITYNFLDKPDSILVNGKGRIAYTYDAAGVLLQKTITDTKLNTQTVITYIAGFVYQKIVPAGGNAATVPDTLQYVLHEEGRIRYTISSTTWAYDYFLKDHLGNIRSVVTGEQRTDAYPPASLETAAINNEKLYYSGLDNGIVNKNTVSGYPSNDTYTNPNDFIQKLSGATNITGAGILLKVMAGDKLNVHAGSWYKLNGVTPDQPVSPLPGLITALLNGVPGISGNKILASQLNSGILNPSLTGFLNTRDAAGNSSRPAAWLNIIVLDEQLNPVITSDGKNSYYEQVGPGNTSSVKQYTISGREITKNGYVYIYVSNETPNVNVYWDNLQVTHVRGALLQEEGYYPFGLEMKALCSLAATVTANNYKFNAGTELENSFDVSYYETYFRNYDAQVGRFTGVDALAELYPNLSPYQFGANDPIYWNDPRGLSLDGGHLLPEVTITVHLNHPIEPSSWWQTLSELEGGNVIGTEGGGTGNGGGSGGSGSFSHGSGGGNYSNVDNPTTNVFNTSSLTPPEVDRFNYLIEQIETVPVGHDLINSLNTCGKIIFITNDKPDNPSAAGSYDASTNKLKMLNKLDPSEGFAVQYVLKTLIHELFHALQVFSGITSSPAKEIDAYLFQSLFGRAYGMDAQYYDGAITINPATQDEINFTRAWNNFFDHGYSGSDYRDIYRYFLSGSPTNEPDENGLRMYGTPHALNPNKGGYAIYWFLP